jgi:hypothetical protein
VIGESLGHPCGLGLPQTGAALDVREEKSDSAGSALGFHGNPERVWPAAIVAHAKRWVNLAFCETSGEPETTRTRVARLFSVLGIVPSAATRNFVAKLRDP